MARAGVAAESALPKTTAKDHYWCVTGSIFFGHEGAASDDAGSQHGEEVRTRVANLGALGLAIARKVEPFGDFRISAHFRKARVLTSPVGIIARRQTRLGNLRRIRVQDFSSGFQPDAPVADTGAVSTASSPPR